jgi:hypothetical protein
MKTVSETEAASRVDGASILDRSIPVTWVTVYSGDIGDSYGPKRFSIGSSRHVSS